MSTDDLRAEYEELERKVADLRGFERYYRAALIGQLEAMLHVLKEGTHD